MTTKTPRTRPGRRDGIALVLTLGFLALLLIMAVGFAVSMRVERLATRNYSDVVKARQITEIALVRALREIDTKVGQYPYPEQAVYGSQGAGAANLVDGLASNYVPRFAITRAGGIGAVQNAARWTRVDNPLNYAIGNIAFLAIDCSGLLDANLDHQKISNAPSARVIGYSPLEMERDGSLLRELNTSASIADLVFQHLTNAITLAPGSVMPIYRYETLLELATFNGYTTNGFVGGRPMVSYPINFVTYSRFPTGWRDGNQLRQPMYVGDLAQRVGGSGVAAVRADLVREFTDLGLALNDATDAANNLIDYVDADSIPTKVDSLCTEPTPLINEIVVTNQVIGPNANSAYELSYSVTVELFFPFIGITNDTEYRLTCLAAYSTNGPNTAVPASLINNAGVDIPAVPAWTSGTYRTYTFTKQFEIGGVSSLNNAYALIQNVTLRPKAQQNAIVDIMGGTPQTLMRVNMGAVGAARSWQAVVCNDPRLNWDGTSTVQWQPAPNRNDHSLEEDNSKFAALCTWQNTPTYDGTNAMYVANTNLLSVGELGYLAYSRAKPWQTFSLLGPQSPPVANIFTVHSNSVRHGLVNPNTPNLDVLASAFLNMPVNRYPTETNSGVRRVTQAEAINLANAVKSTATGGSYTNIGDFGRTANADSAVNAALGGVGPLERESVIRNSIGLFHPRQQLYTILLGGQTTGGGSNTTVVAEQRAVALVWRDPYLNSNGVHEVVVRNFKWLTE